MAELATVARPYAEALFEVGENGDLAAWSTFMQELAQLAQLPEVRSIASNPRIRGDQVDDLLWSAVKSRPSGVAVEQAWNFLRMLVDNHRLDLLPQIAAQFEALKNAREGAADAIIVSAFPLEGATLSELVGALERKFGRRLKPVVQLDPSLIGGVRVIVGDAVLDGSMRARLNQMQAALTA